MARLLQCGFESGHYLPEGVATATLAPGIVTSPVHGGTYCAECVGATTNGVQVNFTQVSGRSMYLRVWIRFAGFPSPGPQRVVNIRDSTVIMPGLQVSNGGVLSWTAGGTGTTTLLTNTWYCLEMTWTNNGSAMSGSARINGVQFATQSSATAQISDNAQIGWLGSDTGGSLFLDDIALNDDQGSDQNTWPGTTGVILLAIPVSDNLIGADWKLGTNAAVSANAFQSVNNIPPTGKAVASGADGDQIRDSVNNAAGAASQADLNMQSYTTAGLPSGYLIAAMQLIAIIGDSNASTQYNIGLQLLSNPAEGAETTKVTPTGATTAWPSTSSWTHARNAFIYSPTFTAGTSPVARVAKRTGTTQSMLVCLIGVSFEHTPPSSDSENLLTGGATAGGVAVTGKETLLTGGAIAKGNEVTQSELQTGGAVAGGVALANVATLTTGGAVANGRAITMAQLLIAGGALAGGNEVTESEGDFLVVGGALAKGLPVGSATPLEIGAALAGGTFVIITELEDLVVGGALAGGVVIDGALGALGRGAAVAGFNDVGALIVLEIGGAVAGGFEVHFLLTRPGFQGRGGLLHPRPGFVAENEQREVG